MAYSITTADGITIDNIPDDVAPDSQNLKDRVAEIRINTPAVQVTAPMPTEAEKAAFEKEMADQGFFEGIGESITGTRRTTPTTESLPDYAAMPELSAFSMAGFKSALGTMMTSPEETVQVIQANFPGVQVTQDEKGNYLLQSSIDGKQYAIKPGFQVSDIPRAGAAVAAFTPAGRLSTIPAAIGGAAATQTAIEASQAATGGEFNLGEVGMAAATAPIAPLLSRIIPPAFQAVKEGVKSVVGRVAPSVAPAVAPAVAPVVAPAVAQVIDDAERAGVSLMTSDVLPPRTFASKWLQTVGERIPLAGTGGVRKVQQTQRVDAVRNVLRDFGADDAASATDDVMKDLYTKRGADITKYSTAKTEVIERLGQSGVVPLNRTIQAIDNEIAKLQGAKTKEFLPIIDRLNDWKASLQGQNLINVEVLRKQLGESFKAQELASVRSAGEKSLTSIYKPLKQDMEEFITRVGNRRDVTKWKIADKRLANLAGELDMGTLKSVLRTGNATPEVVAKMLFSKKPSEVKQLYASLTPAGRARARTAILSRASEKSSVEAGEGVIISPDKFASEVKRLGTSIDVFFTGDDLKQIEGLVKVLNITKRASEAAAMPTTGVQVAIPAGAAALSSFFGGGLTGFIGTLGVAGVGGGAARIYESAPVRNLLIKISQTASGSAQQAALIKSLNSTIQQAVQAERQFDQESK